VKFCRRILGVVLVLGALQGATTASQPSSDPAPCSFPAPEIDWIQRALNGWEQVSREFLRIDPTPLPWIVLFDASCIWHLSPDGDPGADARAISTTLTFAGAPVPVRAGRHDGTFLLPSGSSTTVEMKASTALSKNGRAAFFVMSMPSVWRTRDLSAPTRAEFLQGVFSHEMTHTRLLVAINRRVRELARNHDLVYPINDDVIQTEFQRTHGFEDAIKRERDHFYRAALETDPARRREIAMRALAMVRERQARYFKGSNQAYGELESLFLTMEGLGQWAAYRLTKARAGGRELEALRLVRDNRRFWSQDEGLALFLLIDELVPEWQSRIFTSTPASPFTLLGEALAPKR
jgi:hypothetical protein